MFCPSCGNLLQQLDVTTNSGGRFSVDHCGFCGGTWFDAYEVNRIPYHEVARLAHLTVLPQKPNSPAAGHLCPRCHKTITPVQSESVPHGVRFLRCPACHGIWATHKALEEFKKNQEETITEYKTKQVAFPSLSVVFVPALFALLLFFTFLTVTNLQKAKDERTKAAEAISNIGILFVSPTKSTLTFTSIEAYRSSLSLGPSQLEMVTKSVSSTPSTLHKILLSNLSPGQTYFYRIILTDENGQQISGELSFFTQKAD